MAVSALALVIANTPLNEFYIAALDTPVVVQVGALKIAKPLILWINDGLMAIFFFLVGLEIKREFMEGELSSASQIALPLTAAVGGVVVPALIYVGLNWETPANLQGWAIPTATDIAFALGVLALLGSRVPVALKVLLTAIAIFDDLGAIIIIALFYTDSLSTMALVGAIVFIVGLVVANRFKITSTGVYLLLGIGLWICTLKSGVHATLAGVVTAFAIPIGNAKDPEGSLLKDLEHRLHPFVAYLILPLFAFANAGVSFKGIGLEAFIEPIKLGISLGLFLGKQVGVFLFLFIAIKLGLSPMPKGASWRQLYGVAILCGIGFTMSLFIGSLAFEHAAFDAPIRLGVLTGSLVSALAGYLLLRQTGETSGARPARSDI